MITTVEDLSMISVCPPPYWVVDFVRIGHCRARTSADCQHSHCLTLIANNHQNYYFVLVYQILLYFSLEFPSLCTSDWRLLSKSLIALQSAILKFVPQKTYTKKFIEELTERARWASQDILNIIRGGSCQHSGGPLDKCSVGSQYHRASFFYSGWP